MLRDYADAYYYVKYLVRFLRFGEMRIVLREYGAATGHRYIVQAKTRKSKVKIMGNHISNYFIASTSAGVRPVA